MKHRFVPISENISIPVPEDCTAEEEAALVAKFLSENDLAEMEAEAQQLAKDIKEGNMIPIEQLMRELGIEELDPDDQEAA